MQRVTVLEFDDSNMAGYAWSWAFWVTRLKSGRYSVGGRQTVLEDQAHRVPFAYPLRTGEEIWRALVSMMEEYGYSISDHDLGEIVSRISTLDSRLAEEVRQAAMEMAQEE